MSSPLNPRFEETILSATGASTLEISEVLHELWSGYGHIMRIRLDDTNTVIVKHVRGNEAGSHPRGWDSNHSHQRKLKSYQVESDWYRQWSKRCGPGSRVPALLACDEHEDEILLVLEDLDASGYPVRLDSVSPAALKACLNWLANFHANFMEAAPDQLWETGTYWHLATRSDELAALDDLPLKEAAPKLDQALANARYKTIVHGDAKLVNFCFSKSEAEVAAVDFQYVGGGCGMKDLAYFIGSCLPESECQSRETELLDDYFATLTSALASKHPDIDPKAVEADWRPLYRIAWTDFHRFLKGWSPDHWKINSYSENLAREVLASL